MKASLESKITSAVTLVLDYRGASTPERVDTDFARFVPDADFMVPMHVVDARIAYSYRVMTVDLTLSNVFDYYYVERPAYLAPPRQFIARVRVII